MLIHPALRKFPDARLAEVGLRSFTRIADLWGLSIAERMALLGLTSRSTYYHWLRTQRPTASPDLLQRLSFIGGIYKGLRIIFSVDEHAHAWPRWPNAGFPFGGMTPIDYMVAGGIPALYETRRTIDAERGGWP
jgi:hypothetical protein